MNKIEKLEAEIAGLIRSKVGIDVAISETLAEIEKLKAEQQQWPQKGDNFIDHFIAIGVEGLKETADIAAELAHRDKTIERAKVKS